MKKETYDNNKNSKQLNKLLFIYISEWCLFSQSHYYYCFNYQQYMYTTHQNGYTFIYICLIFIAGSVLFIGQYVWDYWKYRKENNHCLSPPASRFTKFTFGRRFIGTNSIFKDFQSCHICCWFLYYK